jgi:hypothetical protein
MSGKKGATGVLAIFLAAASSLFADGIFYEFLSLEDFKRDFVRTKTLFSAAWAGSGSCNSLLAISCAHGFTELSHTAVTSAIILLTRGACSGERDGGGRADTTKFITLARSLRFEVAVSLRQSLAPFRDLILDCLLPVCLEVAPQVDAITKRRQGAERRAAAL